MRKWRVGTVSMGIMLVATGFLLLIGELQGFNGASLIIRWWPAILIILGAEILAYVMFSQEEQPKIRFDGLSIFLSIVIIFVSSGVYAVNTLVKSDISDAIFGDIGYYQNETINNQSHKVDAAKVKKLQVSNSKGRVQVYKYDGSEIVIDTGIIIKNNDEEAAKKMIQDLVEITEGETLSIHTKNVDLFKNNPKYQIEVNYTIRVPKEMSFEIRNEFGEIDLENLIGNTRVVGKHGQIDIRNIQGDLEINNSFGATKVKDVTGKVQIENEHGEINYSNKKTISDDITLRSKMGSVNVELPSTQQGTFKVQTKYGKITFDGFAKNLDLKKEPEHEKQSIEGVIGNASPQISINAEHGAVTLQGR